MKLKDACSLEGKRCKPRQHIKKQRHHFADKGPSSQTMVFPVVMYTYESWAIRKAYCQRTDAFELWCWSRLLSPLDCKEIKPDNPKGNQPWKFTETIDAEAEAPILWLSDVKSQLIGKDLDAGKAWRQKEKRVAEDEKVRWDHWLNAQEFVQTPGDSEGQGSLVCGSTWGCKESYLT